MVTAYIGLGSNVRRLAALRQAVCALRGRFGALQTSGVYESADTRHGGPAYWNAVAGLRTALAPEPLRAALRGIEEAVGRRRDDPRQCVLDLDLLLYGEQVQDDPPLLPHPAVRAGAPHVLVPLADLGAPVHRVMGGDGPLHPCRERAQVAALWLRVPAAALVAATSRCCDRRPRE